MERCGVLLWRSVWCCESCVVQLTSNALLAGRVLLGIVSCVLLLSECVCLACVMEHRMAQFVFKTI